MRKPIFSIDDLPQLQTSKEFQDFLRDQKLNLDINAARIILRRVYGEGQADWIVDFLDSYPNSPMTDVVIEASLFELPIKIGGGEGILQLDLQIGSKTVEVMAFKIIAHREGLVVSRKSLFPSPYSDEVRDRVYEIVVEALSNFGTVKAKLINSKIAIDIDGLAFLNHLNVNTEGLFALKAQQAAGFSRTLLLDFKVSGSDLVITTRLQEVSLRAMSSAAWDKIGKISKAGNINAVVIAPDLHLAQPDPSHSEETEPIASDAELPESYLRVQTEFVALARSFEHMRSIETGLIRSGAANAKLINQCLKGIAFARQAALTTKSPVSLKKFETIEIQTGEIFSAFPSTGNSSHSLVRKQLEQLPMRRCKMSASLAQLREVIALSSEGNL
jgi:hypothetical protein